MCVIMGQVLLINALVTLVFVAGCQRSGQEEKPAQDPIQHRKPPSAVQPEPWASKPPNDWPQLVLTNHAVFNGHTPLRGASAFLIKTGDGRTLAATAKHLLGANGGVEPEISVARLSRVLQSWRMYPRTRPDEFVSADGVGAEGLDDENMDWM